MKPLNLLMALIGLSIKPVSARCFWGGVKWEDRAAARQYAVIACKKGDGSYRDAFEGQYAPGIAVHKCYQHSPTQKIEFMIRNVNLSLYQGLDGDACVRCLHHEINGCSRGGSSDLDGWTFRADPNKGTCKEARL
ncbi:hypothetical protein H9Q72_011729 [Fusarium xylarioides]|uniref:Glycan binding protein Y3-like domain-containing protein n=1 Tax=Fusarium xylarioides TaxID=221167 RepID=A0A9P7L158_9HYPO|nr:hypothetical protein H9Q72_011729 [Fusarium xylarioides]